MGLRITARRSRVAQVITRALAVALLVGCSTAPATSPATSPSSPSDGTVSPPPPSADATPTAWDTEVAALDVHGTRSLGSALQLMAMAFGPIPGVEATLAAPGTVGSASPAVRAIRAHLDELSPAQREAVDRYLTIPSDAKRLEVPPAGGRTSPRSGTLALIGPLVAAGYPYTRFEEELLADAASARTRAAGYFGDMPGLGIHITHMPDEPFVTFFNPTAGAGGVEQCDVIVNSAHNDDRFVMRRAMTLDIVHCFQSRALGTEAGFAKQVPAWAWEGPAQFIDLETWPGITQSDAISWLLYFGSPEDSLFVRSYDAIGFYSQLRQAGGDLSMAFRAVLTDVDDPERFALAGATSNAFLDTWASGLTHSAWGGAWIFDGPGIPDGSVQAPQSVLAVEDGSNEAISQDPYTNQVYLMAASSDILRLDINGRARLGDGNVDAVVAGSAAFCTTDTGCGPCPDGRQPPIQVTRLAPNSLLAVSGGTDGTTGFVSGHPLEEFCKPSPQVCESGGVPAAAVGLPTLATLLVSRRSDGSTLVVDNARTAAGDCPTPVPTDDAFCARWRAYLDWATGIGDASITRELAMQIVTRFEDMQPVAPPEMEPHVSVVITTYRTFAEAPEPFQVPLTGQIAFQMYQGLLAIDGYCGTNAFPA